MAELDYRCGCRFFVVRRISLRAEGAAEGLTPVGRLAKKCRGLTFAPVEHTDEETAARLKALQKIASPLLTVCLSEDRKKVLWKAKSTGAVRIIDPVEVLWN